MFKNSIREIERLLMLSHSEIVLASIMNPFYQIEKDKNFWNSTLDGLAILANPSKCVVYRLTRPVREQVVVADRLHIKPLLRIFQSVDKYQILGLGRTEFALYEGNRDGLEEIEMEPDTPRTIEQVLGDQLTESYLTFGSYGDGGGTTMFHGHGGKKEEIDKDAEKFFRYVDSFVLEKYSKPSGLPLLLVAVTEHHNLFRRISNNPFLAPEGIKSSCGSMKMEQLNAKAWELMEPVYLAKAKKMVTSFDNAKANATGSDNLAQIAKAAIENRVEILLVEDYKVIPGKMDDKTGKLESGEMNNPDNDVLDDLIVAVLKKNGEVVVLPEEEMPGSTGVAAKYRY